MPRKHFQQILILLFLFCTSCATPKTPNQFLLSPSPSLRILELKDHQFCSSLKVDYHESQLMQNRLYWGCRQSSANHHIIKSQNPRAITHNANLNNLINQITNKVANLPESIIQHSNGKVDEKHHKKCLELGFEVSTQDNAKIDDYFGCRSTLIEEYKLLPPYRKREYMKYPNTNYNINFAINTRIQKRLQEYNKQKEKYPTCVKYNIYNPNFNLCTKALDESKKCRKNIKKSRYQQELKAKLNCQRLSYVHFSNDLIKFDDEELSKANRANKKSDYHNNNNFAALGLDEESFVSIDEDDFSEDDGALDPEPLSMNNDKELYTKFEITKLREKYMIKCHEEVDQKMKLLIEEEKFQCDELKKFKKIGE